MQAMKPLGKISGLQFFVRLGYAGNRFYGVVPVFEGPSVYDAVLARLRRGCAACEPYAVCFAARTDRGVHALENWLSFRLRPCQTSCAERILRALAKQQNDGLTGVWGHVTGRRLMARNCTAKKHYRYVLPCSSTQQLSRLQQAADVLTGSIMVGRLAQPSAVRQLGQLRRDGLELYAAGDLRAGEATIDVHGPQFVRHQVRYMVGALQAVQRGDWSVQDLEALAQGRCGPQKLGFLGPASAAGLTLVALWPSPPWHTELAPSLAPRATDA